MSIRYLNNASNEIEYTRQDGVVVTRNPFDPEFVLISQRLSLIHANDAENRTNRYIYEQAVRNAQTNIDAGHSAVTPMPPLMKVTPEDYEVPESTTDAWTPPLLALKPVAQTNVPLPDGFHTLPPVAPAHSSPALGVALGILASLGPALPDLIKMFQALLIHRQSVQMPVHESDAAADAAQG